jgi:hypothetical protein
VCVCVWGGGVQVNSSTFTVTFKKRHPVFAHSEEQRYSTVILRTIVHSQDPS